MVVLPCLRSCPPKALFIVSMSSWAVLASSSSGFTLCAFAQLFAAEMQSSRMITYVGPSYWLTCNSVALAVAPKAHAIRRAAVVLILQLLGLEKRKNDEVGSRRPTM